MSTKFASRVPPAKLVVLAAQQQHHTSPIWIVDTGATHHVTPDINNLSYYSKYEGPDSIHVGNGEGLPIANTGSTFLTTSNHSFSLQNILHVHHMQHNLLSVK